MILGIILTGWGLLSLYAALFTTNQYTFFFLMPIHSRGWNKLFGNRANKALNFFGGIVMIFGDLVLLRSQ